MYHVRFLFPSRRLVAILPGMAIQVGGSPQVRPLSRQLVYQALVDRKK
jgi:hypothetical protein